MGERDLFSYHFLRESLLAPSDVWSCQHEIISGEKVIIIDNALKNPLGLRTFAESLDYDLVSAPREFRVYPGERATVSWSTDRLAECILKHYFKDNTHEHLNFKRQATVFTRMNGEKLKRIHPKQQAPHIDFGQRLVALIHLSDDEYLGATGFYRHLRTGIDCFPPVPSTYVMEKMESDGFNPLSDEDYRAFIKQILYEGLNDYACPELGTGIAASNSVWNVVGIVKARFNRLLIFPGYLIHSPIFDGYSSSGCSRVTLNLAFIPQ